jgi:putative ABC transport system permease protein
MHMSISALPDDTVARVGAVDGVAWAENLRYTTGVVTQGDQSIITYVFGYDSATGRAGPHRIARGAPPGAGEALVDESAADELGIDVGDAVEILGAPLTVSGLSVGGTNIVNTTVFVDIDQFEQLRGPGVNYILVGAEPGADADELANRIADAVPDATVQTRAEFSTQEARIVRDMATDIMAIMTVIGFLIALAVVALTLFTSTLAKLREYGIVKALGGSAFRLALDVGAQALWTIALATLLALLVAIGLGAFIGAVTPNVSVVIEAASVARTALGALGVGMVAAAIPLRRVVGVDPASAFRRAQ